MNTLQPDCYDIFTAIRMYYYKIPKAYFTDENIQTNT